MGDEIVWMTYKEAAGHLRCSTKHIRRLRAAGKLQAYIFGAASPDVRFKKSDLDKIFTPEVPNAEIPEVQ